MTSFKRASSLLLLGTATLALSACNGADDVASPGEATLVTIVTPAPPPPPPPAATPAPTPTPTGPAANCPAGTANVGTAANRRVCQIQGRLTGNTVLRNFRGLVYQLSGVVQVGTDVGPAGTTAGGQAATLTIEPGTVVVGSAGADALVVNRGSQIFAEGTTTQPIIFTSRANLEGNSTDNSIGQWGGVVILGRGPNSACAGGTGTPGTVDCQGAVEGVSNAFYGGDAPSDNSGRLVNVQVRFSGFEVSPGNELNGITLAGVGSGTTINNVQVHNSSDDGIEWFGGRVNHRYLALTGIDDDSIDTDNGYRGDMQFVVAAQRSGGGDAIIEAGTGNDAAPPRSFPRISNFTFVSRRNTNAILLRGGTDFALFNGVVAGPAGSFCVDVDGNATIQAPIASNDAGPPRFESLFLACGTAFRNDPGAAGTADTVTADQIAAAFNAGSNNVSAGTSTLTNTFVNGANETARPVFNVAGISSFFTTPTFIGAVRDANDTSFRGWTCDSSTADFGSGRQCSAAPADTGTVSIA